MSAAVRTALAAAVLAVSVSEARAVWVRLLEDRFESNSWAYAGVSNHLGEALFRHDAGQQRVRAEWDELNHINPSNAPYVIRPSSLSRPLPRVLTDADTFRVGATLLIEPGSIPATQEGYQIANLGLYNLAFMGPDRALADDWDFSMTNRVRNGSDFVEFNYWINNSWGGPTIGSIEGGHTDDDDVFLYNFGNGQQTAMNGAYMPEGTNLYVELTYHGSATGTMRRKCVAAVFSDSNRTQLVVVNGTPLQHVLDPFSTNWSFALTHVAFFNYVAVPFDVPGAGKGSWDDMYVEWDAEPGETVAMEAGLAGVVLTWASEPGTNYAIVSTTNLVVGGWATDAVVQAAGTLTTWTGPVTAVGRTYGIQR